jgi:hypothetical protein
MSANAYKQTSRQCSSLLAGCNSLIATKIPCFDRREFVQEVLVFQVVFEAGRAFREKFPCIFPGYQGI